MFSTKEEMQKALVDKKGLTFRGRELRINRAVEPKRREKKLKRKQEAKEERAKRRAKGDDDSDKSGDEGEGKDVDKLRNFEAAYESDDSEDDKKKAKKLNLPPVVRLEGTAFDKRAKSQTAKDEEKELRLDNMLAFAKRKKQDILRNMILKGTSHHKETMGAIKGSANQKDLFKTKNTTFKSQLKARIETRRNTNLKKINKHIKVKKIKV